MTTTKILAELMRNAEDGSWTIEVGCSYDRFFFTETGRTADLAVHRASLRLPRDYVIEIIETP
jgi:hypothetical protein